MHHKLHEWGKRYVPAEIVSTITSLLVSLLTFTLTENRIFTAFLATWAENTSYYIFLVCRDAHGTHSIKSFLKKLRNIIVEFGPAELLDSFVTRPFFFYMMPLLLNNFPLGILVGKIIADILFYVPTVISYELRKKYWKE